MKVTKEDNFVWKFVNNYEAKKIFEIGLFDLYVLYEDDSESFIETIEELKSAIKNGYDIGIEVGKLEIIIK